MDTSSRRVGENEKPPKAGSSLIEWQTKITQSLARLFRQNPAGFLWPISKIMRDNGLGNPRAGQQSFISDLIRGYRLQVSDQVFRDTLADPVRRYRLFQSCRREERAQLEARLDQLQGQK
jgi:hypothetical protein